MCGYTSCHVTAIYISCDMHMTIKLSFTLSTLQNALYKTCDSHVINEYHYFRPSRAFY